jgi:hypothetical protein
MSSSRGILDSFSQPSPCISRSLQSMAATPLSYYCPVVLPWISGSSTRHPSAYVGNVQTSITGRRLGQSRADRPLALHDSMNFKIRNIEDAVSGQFDFRKLTSEACFHRRLRFVQRSLAQGSVRAPDRTGRSSPLGIVLAQWKHSRQLSSKLAQTSRVMVI